MKGIEGVVAIDEEEEEDKMLSTAPAAAAAVDYETGSPILCFAFLAPPTATDVWGWDVAGWSVCPFFRRTRFG